jgi:hypothetical protein
MNPKKILTAAVLGLLSLTALSACTLDEAGTKKAGDDSKQTQNQVEKTETEAEAKVEITETPAENAPLKSAEVDFNKPVKLNTLKVVANYLKEMNTALGDQASQNMEGDKKGDNLYVTSTLTFYDVGTIKTVPFEGQKLLVLDIASDGPMMSELLIRFAWDEKTGKLTSLEKYSEADYLPEFVQPLLAQTDKDFDIPALDLPNTIMLPDKSNSIKLSTRNIEIQADNKKDSANPDGLIFVDLGKVAFSDPKVGNVYLSATGTVGCLFVIAPDGTLVSYSYDPALISDKNSATVKWNDGSDSTWLGSDYEMYSGGCGIGASCYMVDLTSADQLVEAGKTSNGLKIYTAKDTRRIDDTAALDALVDKNQPLWQLNYSYNQYRDMQQYLSEDQKADKLKTYEEFLADRPVIYWQDPLGRFSTIINTTYKPPAECGKPVIYLYPEKASEVSVMVGIDEFTATVPDYGQGWKVLAQPNGELTNLADGLKYGYLFWEGKSDKKLSLGGGSVVAKADLEEFLNGSLTKLGLNEKEAAEFKEFWLPKMLATAEPYVLVSFVGTHEFNKIAPLTIEPKPDTLIRVFMYYQPLAIKITMPAQKLTAPARRGFTVVEWGGTSSDGWQIK